MRRDTIRDYYRLAKPGIIYANVMTAVAGYLLAAHWRIQLSVLAPLAFGMGLLIGGAGAFNNYLDRNRDKAMQRTQKRALVSGRIGGTQALIFASLLSAGGLVLLAFSVNTLTLILGVVGLVDYVVLYGFAKRYSVHGTLVGCISGAVPLVAGYTAITNQLDTGAWLLFIIMLCWQMAHFYAIALYRLEDYRAARFPVMPVVHGPAGTKAQTVVYIVLFTGACVALSVFGYASYWFAGVMGIISLGWLYRGWQGYRSLAVAAWGRTMFLYSLLVILGLSAMLALGGGRV